MVETCIAHFEISLYAIDRKGQCGLLRERISGTSSLPQALLLNGYSKTQCIDLEPSWSDILRLRLMHYRTRVTTYETIERFGDIQQLVDEYELVFNVEFSDTNQA